jgi:hypothetical protein
MAFRFPKGAEMTNLSLLAWPYDVWGETPAESKGRALMEVMGKAL